VIFMLLPCIHLTLLLVHCVDIVRRARIALSFLEIAIDAGSNVCSREAAFAYVELAKHARKLATVE
jgi:hypothetical protein